jgi:signal transduction histidine kinase/putative methionine-R-sulfoxide reductase with GAF domain
MESTPQSHAFDSETLVSIMKDMSKSTKIDDLLTALFNGTSKQICNSQNDCYGWVGKLNRSTGKIEIVASTNFLYRRGDEIEYSKGIAAKALADRKIKDIPDLQKDSNYLEHWGRAQSKIVVPIFLSNSRAMRNRSPAERETSIQNDGDSLTETIEFKQPIGVINFESALPSAFSQILEEPLTALCLYAGDLIDKIDRADKLESLNQIDTDIKHREKKQNIVADYDEIIRTLIKDVAEKLNFGTVHISLVDRVRDKIESKYVYGSSYTEAQIDFWHENAKFSIKDSDDIQAHIVRHGKTEVPEIDDSRFNPELYKKLNHSNFIRIYIPIVDPASNSVIGTLEAGYHYDFNQYIYEFDRYLLSRVIDLFLNARERKRAVIINTVIHDLRSPTSNIRSIADHLSRQSDELERKNISKKARDIFNEAESLLYSATQLEYALTGKLTRVPRPRLVNIYTQVLVKSVKDHRELLGNKKNLNQFQLRYDRPSSRELESLTITTDVARLLHVMHNLIDNAVKYRKEIDPDSWQIHLSMEKREEFVDIFVQDLGIGISPKHKKSIFNLGFREPQVVAHVLGSGLGLAIARDMMREIGGDLQLQKCQNPTTFKVCIPLGR